MRDLVTKILASRYTFAAVGAYGAWSLYDQLQAMAQADVADQVDELLIEAERIKVQIGDERGEHARVRALYEALRKTVNNRISAGPETTVTYSEAFRAANPEAFRT